MYNFTLFYNVKQLFFLCNMPFYILIIIRYYSYIK